MNRTVTWIPVEEKIPVTERLLRVAVYCRVSTKHEEQNGSIELQEKHFRALIEQNRNWINAGIFTERAHRTEAQKTPAV